MPTIHKTCRDCGVAYEFSEKEQDILQKISPVFHGVRYDIPVPEICGSCRLQRIVTHQNEINLFKNISATSGHQLISNIRQDSGFTIIERELYQSDAFEPLVFGQDVDSSRSFFDQYHQLNRRVPRMNLSNKQAENSPYVNSSGYQKNCYFTFNSGFDEECYYGYRLWHSNQSADCTASDYLEKCYQCVDCHNCFNSAYLLECDKCNDSYLLYNCKNCTNCIGCFGLRNKEYHINNMPVTKEEYEALVARIKGASYGEIREMWNRFLTSIADVPRRFYSGENNENITGNYLNHCRNVFGSQNMNHCEDCYDCMFMEHTKDSISVYRWGMDSELCYNSGALGFGVQQIAFCTSITESCTNLYYCEFMNNCRDCFGCNGLEKKRYCILNKQYTKEAYETLVPRIIDSMRSVGEWGWFFPVKDSPFAYNESVADIYFPLSKEQIEAKGYRYVAPKDIEFSSYYPLASDRIAELDEGIINQVIQCEVSQAPFRITGQEYAFYKVHGIPIPRRSFGERLRERGQLLSPFALWERPCDKCGAALQTSYEKEKIYCEACYLAFIG